jgi:hypothetical protein
LAVFRVRSAGNPLLPVRFDNLGRRYDDDLFAFLRVLVADRKQLASFAYARAVGQKEAPVFIEGFDGLGCAVLLGFV